MAKHIPRIFVPHPLRQGDVHTISDAKARHLATVLRLKTSDKVHIFNGLDGAWESVVSTVSKRDITLSIEVQIRQQPPTPSPLIVYLAGIKKPRFNWAIEKLTEIGVTDIYPLITEYTQVRNFQIEKLETIAIEAVEQCGSLSLPIIHAPVKLSQLAFDVGTSILVPDESSADMNSELFGAVPHISKWCASTAAGAVALIIGPEGGFSSADREMLKQQRLTQLVSLGPRILRSETAAVVAAISIQNLRSQI